MLQFAFVGASNTFCRYALLLLSFVRGDVATTNGNDEHYPSPVNVDAVIPFVVERANLGKWKWEVKWEVNMGRIRYCAG
jgi:hypothetical protein